MVTTPRKFLVIFAESKVSYSSKLLERPVKGKRSYRLASVKFCRRKWTPGLRLYVGEGNAEPDLSLTDPLFPLVRCVRQTRGPSRDNLGPVSHPRVSCERLDVSQVDSDLDTDLMELQCLWSKTNKKRFIVTIYVVLILSVYTVRIVTSMFLVPLILLEPTVKVEFQDDHRCYFRHQHST